MTRPKFSPTLVSGDDLPEYPFGVEDRLDAHWFFVWERRRWLNSDMGLSGDWDCKAMFFDLINHAYDQSPIGSLPFDMDKLARLIRVDATRFRTLADRPYGPLHNWYPCRCGDDIRLMHDTVVRSLTEGFARRDDNRARNEAANAAKRIQRLRITLASIDRPLSEMDHAVRWIDEWLVDQGCTKRVATWIEKAIRAWMEHRRDMEGYARRR